MHTLIKSHSHYWNMFHEKIAFILQVHPRVATDTFHTFY